MRPHKLRRTAAALALGTVLLSACAPTTSLHGYVPSPADVARIRPGVDTQESVLETLGRPSSAGLLQDSAWYYVQSTIENYTYNPPRVVDRVVLAVNYDTSGVVRDISRYGLEDGRVVNLTTRTTETGGRTLGVLEQLFGNLLNIDAQQVLQP